MENRTELLLPLAGLTAVTGATGLILYRLLRRKPPTHVKVNCWFCSQNTVVPYGNRNCWDCPNCEQYNGFQENGDYNKPIPAQHSEHLNHLVSGGNTIVESTKPQQWVNCGTLLCKKCNNNQSTKIKQLASFSPREEERYEEEIEVYKHHLEQMYKLCRPCQTAIDSYIKYQNRQLRAIMLNQQFKRRELDKGYTQSSLNSAFIRIPTKVILLRCLAFLSCAFLVSVAQLGTGDLFSLSIRNVTNLTAEPRNESQTEDAEKPSLIEKVIGVLPERTLENLNEAWHFGRNNQIGLAFLGLVTCVFAMFLAGRFRMRLVDAFASFLWVLVTGLYLSEIYLLKDSPSWMDTVKLSTTTLCCLVGLTSAMATKKAISQRRQRPRRYLSGDSVSSYGHMNSSIVLPDQPTPLLSTPPGLLHLLSHPAYRAERKASPSSLPGRLNRALSLGTIPSLARADSGYLFSGSRPASRSSVLKESPGSDYFSLLSGSCAASPLPSPTPSVAGSATSSCGSLLHRRPLISPARLNLRGQKLGLSLNRTPTRPCYDEVYHPDSSLYSHEITPKFAQNTMKLMAEAGSVSSNHTPEKNSSHSSSCQVDSTTAFLESPSKWKSCGGMSLTGVFLALSFTMNVVMIVFFYQKLL
ncbi:transmembrane protein 201 isoform X2 [Hyla sarda]|uniref:transmembrane protein 201 isoform X2 n=1 Tax=Hyla sarda TaxID=327740 RepID=UPI0024C2D761|nr:transmembrane protein 201 isoform X2 [Hyla sarda]